jgi:hypothetical protein
VRVTEWDVGGKVILAVDENDEMYPVRISIRESNAVEAPHLQVMASELLTREEWDELVGDIRTIHLLLSGEDR